ncbi:phosphatidylinositol-glycan biosynthesis class X protein [Xyrichtys novacula]|uniref:Phosphatidylinositol-glycan biosynthesis class X protein n=1 Tax=Xyrichtys novacula TaxID=13765 RepID=A0AAV1FHQ9_XYRNO|nr:phosphatidylinositol-glycan biosynthesis class X protein [Xyrichtys novacula]
MNFALFSVLACLSIGYGSISEVEDKEKQCDVLKQLLESSAVSVELKKDGFHRELVTSVELRSDDLRGVRVLLVHRWPSGVYVDPFELSSLHDQRDWQILLDSAIDLELPAHKTYGFVTYVFLTPNGPSPRRLTVTIPIHARYHKSSFDGKSSTAVEIKPPELLLRTEKCTQLDSLQSYTVMEAPCTSDNSSTCAWAKIHQQQAQTSLTLQIPVGDGSRVILVSAGTLLVTMICCVGLSRFMWKHRIKQ